MTSATTKRLGVLLIVALAPVLHYAVPGASWIRTSAALFHFWRYQDARPVSARA